MTGTEGVHSTKALNFLVFACTLYCFQSFNVWFLWGSTIKIIALLLCVFSIFYNRSYNNVFNKFRAQHLFIAVFFAIVSINAANSESIISLVKSVLDIYIIANVITLKKEVLKKQFSVITTVFAIISLISLLGWLVYLFDPELLPHTSIQSKDLGYRFDNYYIFLRGVSILPRFCSVFLEPGHYILISCPILFINKFNIRDKRILIILVASIFAFSLAFFLVCIFALICFNHNLRSILLYVFIFIIGAIAVPQIQKINGGDNIVNQLIIMRLQVDDDKGLSGNNRNSDDFNRYYNKFLKSDKVYFGDGDIYKIDWEGGNAGYKVFLASNGIIPTFFIVFFYFILIRIKGVKYNRKIAYLFFFLQMLLFAQAAYPLWFFTIFLYLTGIVAIESKKY